jgi:hypothetical protein
MDPDNFKPPNAELGDPPRRPGSLIRAVLTGTAIEIVGTLVLGAVLGIGYGLLLGAQGYDEDAMKQAMTHIDPLSAFGLFGSLLGSAVSVFAGYACAAIAHRPDYRPVLMMAAISVCLGLLFGGDDYEWPLSLLFSLLTAGCVVFGGWLHLKDMRGE